MSKVILICVVLAGMALIVAHAKGQPDERKVLEAGYIQGLPLSEFAASYLDPICDLLEKDEYDQAAPLLRQAVQQHPEDLVAFVCLAQSDAAYRNAELSRLEKYKASPRGYPNLSFRMGTLHFYNAKATYFLHSNIAAEPELTRAKQLLEQAWKQNKAPIVGLMYAEANLLPSPNFKIKFGVLEELIAHLGGTQVYAAYQEAKQNSWQTPTPSASQMPKKNLKPLRGVVRLLTSMSGMRVGHGVKNGNHYDFTYDPVPPDRQRMAQYFAKWRGAIDQALAQQ